MSNVYFRRGSDRRGDRRDTEHRKSVQDDEHDRNVRERDQSKGRQSQFHDDYSGIYEVKIVNVLYVHNPCIFLFNTSWVALRNHARLWHC